MNLFSETIENTLTLKKKFLVSQLRNKFQCNSYKIDAINKLIIETDYVYYIFSYLTGDMEHDDQFNTDLIEIILTHLEQMKDEKRLPELHYNLIKENLFNKGINKF